MLLLLKIARSFPFKCKPLRFRQLSSRFEFSIKGQLLATQVDFNNLFTDFIFDFKFRPFLTIKPEIVTLVLGDFLEQKSPLFCSSLLAFSPLFNMGLRLLMCSVSL